MLSLITCDNGIDPTVVVGGVVNNLGTNSVNGKSDYVVAEADESDGSFLKFRPYLAVITNIEMTIWTIMERKKDPGSLPAVCRSSQGTRQGHSLL